MDAVIRVDRISFAYQPGVPVLRDVALEIARGAYVAVLGANGSGKSTLARHLNGLLLPQSGRVTVDGLDTADPEARLEIRRRIGMVFQDPDNQIVATTVEDDVAFGLENFNVDPAEIAVRVTRALAETGLETVRTRPPHLLSGGQKQRLAIAAALAMEQPIVVLDEATSMLDARGRDDVLHLVRRLHRRGTTIIAVTHHMEEVLEAEWVVVLDRGAVALTGTPTEIFRESRRLRALNLDVPRLTQVAVLLHEQVPSVPPGATRAEEIAGALGSRGPAVAPPGGQPLATASEPPVVAVERLAHVYLAGTPLAHTALKRADMTVRPGEAFAIVGATGSGKSTVMQHLNGLYRPQQGRVVAVGVDLSQPRADIAAVRSQVGLLFQSPEDQLFEQLVGDDVAYGPFQLKLPLQEVRERVRWALEAVGLDFAAFVDRPIFALSGGEKRRVALAGVLALKPRVLVLDEPTAGLDPASAADLLARLEGLRSQGVTIVFVTHNLEEVLHLADRVVFIEAGETQGMYEVADLVRDPSLLEQFGLTVPPLLRLQQLLRAQGWPAWGRTPAELVASLTGALPRRPAVAREG